MSAASKVERRRADEEQRMRPVGYVATFSPSGIPTGVITCHTALALLASVARVTPADRIKIEPACSSCGSRKAIGQSCGCFDNGCE